jgi:hypothetical protein
MFAWIATRFFPLAASIGGPVVVPQKCLRCGLVNPSNAQRCDCGYDFPSQTVKQSYLAPKDLAALDELAPGEIIACVIIPLVGLGLGFRARSRGRARAGRRMLQISTMALVVGVAVRLWLYGSR